MNTRIQMAITLIGLTLLATALAGDNILRPQGDWKPIHPQSGQEVTATIKLFVNTGKPFNDPRSGKMKYQSKAGVVREDGANEPGANAWVYLFTTNSLPSNATLRVTGTFTVSEGQRKGGFYDAFIDVTNWTEISSNKASDAIGAEAAPQHQR